MIVIQTSIDINFHIYVIEYKLFSCNNFILCIQLNLATITNNEASRHAAVQGVTVKLTECGFDSHSKR